MSKTSPRPITPKQQKLVLYTHTTGQFFYVGVYDYEDLGDFARSSSLNTNYGKAKYLNKKANATSGTDEVPRGMNSGFMMTLINTDYQGWTRIELDEVYPDQLEAATAKEAMISELSTIYGRFVGKNFFVKGVAGNAGKPATWNQKWKGDHPQKWFNQRAEFVLQTFPDTVNKFLLRKNAYFEYSAQTRTHNYGDYSIDCLANLYRYIRNNLGYDLA